MEGIGGGLLPLASRGDHRPWLGEEEQRVAFQIYSYYVLRMMNRYMDDQCYVKCSTKLLERRLILSGLSLLFCVV